MIFCAQRERLAAVEDIQAQCLTFLFAEYETSSTTLGFVCYRLALDTHVQDKLRDEIDRMWPGDEVGLSLDLVDYIYVCHILSYLVNYFCTSKPKVKLKFSL